MDINKNKVLICNCENTMDIDGDKLGKACGASSCKVYSNLCDQELNIVGEALKESKEGQKIYQLHALKKQKHLNPTQKKKNFFTPKHLT